MPSSVSLVVIILALSCSFAYTPYPRTNHNSVLIENLLMIYGGQTAVNGYGVGNTLILLPIDNSFNTNSPPYSSDSGPRDTGPSVYGGAMIPGGENHDELFVYGGNIDGGVQLAIYNQISDTFTNTSWAAGTGPALRDSHSAVTNISSGEAYIFGGETNPENGIALNDLWILDTMRLLWFPIASTIPLPRQAHTATLTTDGRMVIIGGQTNVDVEKTDPAVVPMSDIDIFDTISQQWSNVNASNPPQARLSHTAVCTRTNQIIVFWGDNGTLGFLGDLIVLDMNTSPPSWSKPNTTGLPPLPRFGHSATIVGTIMFIIYGQVSDTALDSNIYALDTTTFTWTTNYIPSHLEYTWPGPIRISIVNNATKTEDSGNLALSTIIDIIISVLGIGIICALIILFAYLRSQARKKDIAKQKATQNEADFFPRNRTTIQNSRPSEDKQNLHRPNSFDYNYGSERPSSMSSNPIRSSFTGAQDNFPNGSYENFGTKRHSNNTPLTPLTQNPSSPAHSMQSENQLQTIREPSTLLLSQENEPSPLATNMFRERYQDPQQQNNPQLKEEIETPDLEDGTNPSMYFPN